MAEGGSENMVPALIATAISGLSTGVGGLIIMFFGKPSDSTLGHMLSLSAGVMLYISFMDLLTESVIRIGFIMANIWFFAGMLLFALIITFFPEPELIDKKAKAKSASGKPSPEYLKTLGIITAIGISLHNFPEGMAVYISCLKGIHMGLPLTLAIAAHNIPEGMAVAAPIYGATGSKWQALWYSTLSGLCEPLGAVIFGLLLGSHFTEYIIQCMLAGVAGIMVYMSIRELMPATLKYIKPGPAAISHIIGMAIIAASIHYLHGMLPHSHTRLDIAPTPSLATAPV
jgi:ZIP family zinc transporter